MMTKSFCIHCSDNIGPKKDGRLSFSDDMHILPGKGKIDWDILLKRLKRINYKGFWVFEINPKVLAKEKTGDVLKNITRFKKDIIYKYFKKNEQEVSSLN
jgi:sugar phosphate isomerase/epimerase